MSLSHKAGVFEMSAGISARKDQGYGFILILLGFALTLLVLSAIFTPVAIGSGIDDGLLVIGP